MTLTSDQEQEFLLIKANLEREIQTESAFTEQEKEDVLKAFKKDNSIEMYNFLKQQRPSAKAVKLWLEGLTRRTTDRVKEAQRAAKHPAAHKETFDKQVRAAIGYSMSESKDRVIKELRRLSKKSDATWKALGLNKKETLKRYGI